MKKVRYITDAAMITAIVIALLLISELTGLELEESFFFVLPAPIALYALMHGAKKSLIPAFAIGLLSMVIHSPIHGLLFVLPACLLGVIYGFFVEKGFSSAVKISLAVLGTFVVNILTMVVFSEVLFGISIIDDTAAIVGSIVNALSFLNLGASFGALLEALAIGLIPAIIVTISLMEGLLMHILTIFLATRVAKIDKLGVFHGFKVMIPQIVSFIFVPIAVVTLIFIGRYLNLQGFWKILLIVGINLCFTLFIVYIFEGLALSVLYFRSIGRPGLYSIVALFAIILFPIIFFVGLADSLFKLQDHLMMRN